MKYFRIKMAAILIAIFGLVAGPLSGAALAATKVALVLDVGGRGDLSFNDMGCLLYTSPSPRDRG